MKRINESTVLIEFEKEGTDWYAVVPEWEGSKADLQMVANADVMCDIIGQGEDYIYTSLTTKDPGEYKARLIRNELTPSIGGATYFCHWNDNYNLEPMEIWLCAVTEYVMGRMPETIWIL